MPSVVQTQTVNSIDFMLKHKTEGPIVAAFTAVNGKTSPSSPRRLNSANGMPTETINVRPPPQQHTEPPPDQKVSLPGRESWPPTTRPSENPTQNGHHSVSPRLSSEDDQDGSLDSSNKRKRHTPSEDERSYYSPESAPVQARRRLDSYSTVGRDVSPNTQAQAHRMSMEHPQTRTLPPIDRADYDRHWPRDTHPVSPTRWISPDSQGVSPNGTQSRDFRAIEPRDPNGPPSPGMDPSSTTEITRAGVVVDPKKRKRVSLAGSFEYALLTI